MEKTLIDRVNEIEFLYLELLPAPRVPERDSIIKQLEEKKKLEIIALFKEFESRYQLVRDVLANRTTFRERYNEMLTEPDYSRLEDQWSLPENLRQRIADFQACAGGLYSRKDGMTGIAMPMHPTKRHVASASTFGGVIATFGGLYIAHDDENSNRREAIKKMGYVLAAVGVGGLNFGLFKGQFDEKILSLPELTNISQTAMRLDDVYQRYVKPATEQTALMQPSSLVRNYFERFGISNRV